VGLSDADKVSNWCILALISCLARRDELARGNAYKRSKGRLAVVCYEFF